MWETAFDVSMLIEPKVIVSCPRFELVEDFMNLLADNGIRWCGFDQDIPSKDNSNWEGYMGSTCYWIDDEGLAYSSMDYAEEDEQLPFPQYSGYIRCTFYGIDSVEEPDIDEEKFMALF